MEDVKFEDFKKSLEEDKSMEDIKDELNVVNLSMEVMFDNIIKLTPKMAKIYRQLYLNLIVEGFTEEQAMTITATYEFKK